MVGSPSYLSNNIEQNMSALYESPAAPARPARRSIHTALLHGSEEKEGDEYEGAVPQTIGIFFVGKSASFCWEINKNVFR